MKAVVIALLCLAIALPLPGLATDYLVTDTDGAQTATQVAVSGKLQAAVEMLDAGSLLDALNAFAKLGTQDDANRYAAYAQALLSLRRDDSEAAVALLSTLGGFLDSDYQLALAQASRLHRYAENGRFGYVDATGAWKIPPQFDWAERVFRAESAPEHSRSQPAYKPEDLYLVAAVFVGETEVGDADTVPSKGLYGLVRNDGTLIAPAQYTEVLWTVNGIAALQDRNGVTLLSIATGQAIGTAFEAVGPYAGGYIPVCRKGLWGYLNPKTGSTLGAGYVWESAQPFSEGKAGVSLEGQYGFINETGAVVVDLKYAGVAPYSEGFAGVRVRNRWGFINKAGILAVPPGYTEVGAFQNGLCAVERGGSWGLINAKNEVVLRIKYSEIGAFDPIYHRAWIRQNKLWGLVSTSGTVVSKPAWATHDEFNGNTLCRVSYKKRYGFIDANGKTRIPNQYYGAAPFTADYAAVADSSGAVRYLNKSQNSFAIDTDVPVECRNGFIEGRTIQQQTRQVMDPTGWAYAVVDRSIAYALYTSEGAPIAVPPYAAVTSAAPTATETVAPTAAPTAAATAANTDAPSVAPTVAPTATPTIAP